MNNKNAESKKPKLEDKFICKFDPDYHHLFVNPKILPCNNTICVMCLRNHLNVEGNLQCTYCKNIHFIPKMDELRVDNVLEQLIMRENANIADILLKDFNKTVYELIERFKDREVLVNNLFNYLKGQIEKRYNQVKIELDLLLERSLSHLMSLRGNLTSSLDYMDSQMNKKVEEFKHFSDKMNYTIHDPTRKKDENENTFEDTLANECQKKIDEVKELQYNFSTVLHRVNFTPSNWKPDLSVLGQLTPLPFSRKAKRIKIGKPLIINIEKTVKDPHTLCAINANILAITDRERKQVCLFDESLRYLTSIKTIGNKNFDRPTAMCVDDENDNLYIYDQGLASLYITDKRFLKIKRIIKDDFIEDLFFFDGHLVILDRLNSMLKVYTNDGVQLREYYLYNKPFSQYFDESKEPFLLRNPVRVLVNKEFIAVLDSDSEIYIYDFELKLKHVVGASLCGNNWSMTFVQHYLFTHGEDGLLTCYETTVNRTTREIYFTPSFMRKMDYYLNFSWHMVYFNQQLIVLSENLGRKSLIAI